MIKFDLNTFYKASDLLELSTEERQLVLGTDPTQIEERIRETVRICFALFAMFHSWERPQRWLRLPNRGLDLNGEPAVKLMTSGSIHDLRILRQHLEYWAYNGW